MLCRPAATGTLAASIAILGAAFFLAEPLAAQTFASATPGVDVTFSRDVAPILQRSCQGCHREGGVAPMSLVTYQEVRRWAARIKEKTGLRDRAGAMPPWYVEKDIGIQHYKNDPSLNDAEIAAIAAWADNGAPEGSPADLPPALVWNDDVFWTAGEPDLVVETDEIYMEAGSPDWWGEIQSVPIPITEDRYVRSVEIREVNDVDVTDTGRQTVGGRYIFHHMIWSTRVISDGDDTSCTKPAKSGGGDARVPSPSLRPGSGTSPRDRRERTIGAGSAPIAACLSRR
jgi:hypothetical protein